MLASLVGRNSQESPENSEFFVSEDKKTIVKMAYIYAQEGRWDKAIAEYRKLIALDPADGSGYALLGDAYAKKGSVQEAFDTYVQAADAHSRQGAADKMAE